MRQVRHSQFDKTMNIKIRMKYYYKFKKRHKFIPSIHCFEARTKYNL